jgi:hypothetical protein
LFLCFTDALAFQPSGQSVIPMPADFTTNL